MAANSSSVRVVNIGGGSTDEFFGSKDEKKSTEDYFGGGDDLLESQSGGDDKESETTSSGSDDEEESGSDDKGSVISSSGSDGSLAGPGQFGGRSQLVDALSADPLFIVLNHFLVDSEGKNIVEALNKININLSKINSKLNKSMKHRR